MGKYNLIEADDFLSMLSITDEQGYMLFDEMSISNLVDYLLGYVSNVFYEQLNQNFELKTQLVECITMIVSGYFYKNPNVKEIEFKQAFKEVQIIIFSKMYQLMGKDYTSVTFEVKN